MPKLPFHKLPLDGFIEQLELAGYYVSPGQRIQLLKVLEAFGTDELEELRKLKFRLCPIVAKTEREQQEFYQLYDQYIEKIAVLPKVETPLSWWQKIPRLQLALLLLPVLGAIGYLVYNALKAEESIVEDLIVDFEHPPEIRMRDTILFDNVSQNVNPSEVQFRWELRDEATGKIEDRLEEGDDWYYKVGRVGSSFEKLIILVAEDKAGQEQGRDSSYLKILCARYPRIRAIQAPEFAQIGEEISFGAVGRFEPELEYRWDFTDGDTSTLAQPKHTFNKSGAFDVQLTVSYPEAKGYCTHTRTQQIVIGQKKAYLATATLQKDQPEKTINFAFGVWLLLGLLGLLMLYYWYKWLSQEPPPPAPKAEQNAPTATDHSDKAPYHIPFRPNNRLIQTDAGLFRLADILRQRQEGLRQVIDIPATVKETLDKGGFPALQFRSTTRPSEYLFLIDEQARASHQARLYEYVATFLKSKDVYVTVFWYNKDLIRFWNTQYKDGMGLDGLYRLYPRHRLVVLGDAHSLLDSQSSDKPALKSWIAEELRDWPNRLLLTPRSTASWTYKEQVLYQLFTIFPSNMAGFKGAMAYLEVERDEEDEKYRIPYDQWVTTHSDPPVFPNINYVRWRKAESYKQYFADYPEVYRWLCALAVYPNPTWEITLAIGHAIGAEVSLENLLLLAQVPWLKGERFSPRLREKLLAELDEATIQQARNAAKETLTKGVNPIVEGSHAQQELEGNLAVQNIILDPHNGEYQEQIRMLQEKGWLNSRQYKDIDVGLAQTSATQYKDLNSLLESGESEQPAPPEQKLLVNGDYYRALTTTLLLILLSVGLWYGRSSALLNQLLLGESRQVEEGEDLNRNFFFQEELVIDSALYFNNLGVDKWAEAPEAEGFKAAIDRKTQAVGLFRKALELRGNDYPLAAANARKGAYNLGVDYLHRFLDSDFDDRLALQEAKNIFNEAEGQQRSAISRKVLHGLGLVNFYDGAVSEAISYRDQLLKRSELYFDTLSTYPHLDALLRPELYQVETITPIRDPRCYQITNAGEAGLSFFNRPLSQKEMDELSQNNTPSRSNRNNQTQQVLSTLADSTEVRLLGESQSFYRIRVQEQTGYILKDNDGTTIVLCPEKSVVEVSPSYRAPSLSSFGAPIKRPRYLWCLDNAEGALQAGKRSPVLEDGRQFFEYEFSRDIVRRIINRLDRLGVEYFNVVPEVEVDAFLQERVERINQKASSLPKVVISINSNTLTVGKQQWNPALSGIEVWHSHNSVSGKQVAEVFANQLVRATGWKNRGAKSREKDRFYILRRANATTIITENGFYSNEEQTLELLSDSTRQKIADAHVRAILELERNGIPGIEATTTAPTTTSDDTNQNTATNDPEEEANTPTNDTDQDGIPNDKDQCPEEAGDLPNGCTNQITFSVLLSDSGEPAIGTIVIVRGTSLGTILDSDENTSIEGVSRDSRLVFSYTGYETQELSLSQMVDQDYTITLTPSATLETELQKRLKALQLDEPIRIYFDEDRPREGKIIERIDQLFTEYLSRRDIYKQYNKDAEEVDQFFDEMETNNDLLNKGAVGKAIVAALEAGKQVEMQVEAYTSSQGSQRYNNALADRMLRSFTNAVENGNLKQYIDAGQLKITTINRGESGTSAGKVTNPKEANNAYSITRARERRIEITSIEVSDPPRKKGRK